MKHIEALVLERQLLNNALVSNHRANEKIKHLEKKIEDGLSCCCAQCVKHNMEISSNISCGVPSAI